MLVAAGCQALYPDPSLKRNCNRYTVYEGESMGYVTEIKELAPKEVQSECKSGHIGAKNHYRGCVLRNETPEGSLTIVYQKGDKEAYYHELAHVTCGPHHTGAYYRGIYTTR